MARIVFINDCSARWIIPTRRTFSGRSLASLLSPDRNRTTRRLPLGTFDRNLAKLAGAERLSP